MPRPTHRAPAPFANGHASVLTEARRLYELSFWIVPCEGKECRVKGWPTQRLEWPELNAALSLPDRNIGFVVNQSNLIDVECDSPEAEDALLRMFGGRMPRTPAWQSRRGKHYEFRRPPGLADRAVVKHEGIEFRGVSEERGTLAIIPPSITDGFLRFWLPGMRLGDVEPADLPPEVVNRLRAAGASSSLDDAVQGEGRILEGKRNDELFKRACGLTDLKLPAETVVSTLLDLNNRLCDPPLAETEVREIAASAGNRQGRAQNFAQLLIGELELWHDPAAEPFATVAQGEHKENWRIGRQSRAFRRLLARRYYDLTGKVTAAHEIADLVTLLEGRAVFDGPEYATYRRVAGQDGKLYLDLCDAEWRAVEIGPDGWRVVADPQVKFLRAGGMVALPEPVRTRRTLRELLAPFLNVAEQYWPLVAVWLTAALRAVGPYPLLKLLAEQGSGKTTLARVCRGLVDPSASPVRAEPRDARDLMIAANNGWLLVYDNLSTVPGWLSDALCRMSTGGGTSTRKLYTDDDEVIFDACRPVILTSIEDIGARSDLLDRTLIIELPTIDERGRRAEKTFWAEYEAARPEILGALLNVVTGGLRRLPSIESDPARELSRLADFCQWAAAVEEPLGLAPGEFARAYKANMEAAHQIALESSPLIAVLLSVLEKHPVLELTAADLLTRLTEYDSTASKAPGWPKVPRVLSAILKRCAPNLRAVGVTAVQDTRGGGNNKVKIWRIEKADSGKGGQGSGNSDPCDPCGPGAYTPVGPPSNREIAARFAASLKSKAGSQGSQGPQKAEPKSSPKAKPGPGGK